VNKNPPSDRYGQLRSSAAAIKVPFPPLELTEPGTAEGGGAAWQRPSSGPAETVKRAGSAIKGLFGGDKNNP
jgi:hypothetical protein